MKFIENEINLNDLFEIDKEENRKGCSVYRFRGMICYYGLHYVAFFHTGGTWMLFDDTRVIDMKDFNNVTNQCISGRLQPTALLYEQVISLEGPTKVPTTNSKPYPSVAPYLTTTSNPSAPPAPVSLVYDPPTGVLSATVVVDPYSDMRIVHQEAERETLNRMHSSPPTRSTSVIRHPAYDDARYSKSLQIYSFILTLLLLILLTKR